MKLGDFKKITRKTYDLIVDDYAQRDKKSEAIAEEFDIKPDLERFAKLLPKGAVVLDIGCGAGRDARFFGQRGFKVIGIDFSTAMIAKTKALSKREIYKVMDLERLKFKNEQFDGIWANASLHHIPKPRLIAVLKKIYCFIKSGGVFFVKVRWGASHGLREQQKFGRSIKRYFSFYRGGELKSVLRGAGFKIIASSVNRPKRWVSVLARK